MGRFLLLLLLVMSDQTVIEAFLFKLLWFCGAGSGESTDADSERETSHCHSGHLQQFKLLCASRNLNLNRGLQESRPQDPPLFFISGESESPVPKTLNVVVIMMLERRAREPESTAHSRQSRPRQDK